MKRLENKVKRAGKKERIIIEFIAMDNELMGGGKCEL